MRNGPVEIAWDIHCSSPEAAADVHLFLKEEGNLERVRSVTMTGGGVTQETKHKLGDYFQAIRVEAPSPEDSRVLRVTFERRPDAGRYWRDLMADVLQAARGRDEAAAVTMAYRAEEPAAPASRAAG